jgi:hypothetical protein
VLRRKKREQREAQKEDEEDVEIPDTETVAVSPNEWEEMKKTMKDAVDQLAVCESTQERCYK